MNDRSGNRSTKKSIEYIKKEEITDMNKAVLSSPELKAVNHPLHNPNDNDCICPGCIGVLTKMASEFANKIRAERGLK